GKIADGLLIRNAATSANFGSDIFRRAMTGAKIQVGCDRHISMMREFVGHFTVPFIPARHVMRQYHGREWTWSERPSKISVDPFAVRAGKCDCFGQHTFIHISLI